ncbi:ceramide-1-phosphate transfer protein-like [Saccostrea echinata]|uniref:ceramide-1-phosphate transfer protein-like n=1 Tax=Saccostrea echinata TaxID=191078 RepID=UPI002A7F86FE|nr:ceramide-1-phosphate transfer protein-like [Saccostrea echinata]
MAEFDKVTKKDFDLEVVYENFKESFKENRDVDLKCYLDAYRELARFFRLCGTLFFFVAKDLEGKISIINSLIQNYGHPYSTVSAMVLHEVNLAQKPGITALLRLHRALELILEFMDRLSKSSDGEKTSEMAADVYSQTMAKHDTWFVQKLAGIAMYTLPSRKTLMETMCKQDYEHSLMLVQEIVSTGKLVYDVIDSEYTNNGLH